MKAPVWRKNSSSTSCWNISSLDCRFCWERLNFPAGTLSARQAMPYQVPVLATLCRWGSILCLKYSVAKSTQVLVQCWKAQLGIMCGQGANHYKLLVGSRIWRHPITPTWCNICNNEGTSLEKEQFFDFLLKHLKLRLSVLLGKAELPSWHSLCKAGNALPGTSLCNALQMGKHTVLEIFGKRHSSACAVLKGTAGHTMWERQITINYWLAPGFEGTRSPPTWCNICNNEGTSLEKEQFCDFLLKHLKLRLSVLLGKAELPSWHSLCKAGNALPGTSLSNALQMGKHTVLEIFGGKKHSSACAVLKGTAGHNMWARANHYQLLSITVWLRDLKAHQRSPPNASKPIATHVSNKVFWHQFRIDSANSMLEPKEGVQSLFQK